MNSSGLVHPYKNARPLTGFTLIEVIITAMLTALAGLAAYNAYSQGISLWASGQKTSHQERAIMFLERISRDLRNTFSFAPIGFTGEEKKISLPALIWEYDWDKSNKSGEFKDEASQQESSVPLPLLAKITYEYNADEGKVSRLLEIYAYPDLDELKMMPDDTEEKTPRTILEDIEKISFSYVVTKTDELNFTDNLSAEENATLPYAVKIELKLKTMNNPLSRTVFIPINRIPKSEE